MVIEAATPKQCVLFCRNAAAVIQDSHYYCMVLKDYETGTRFSLQGILGNEHPLISSMRANELIRLQPKQR